MTHFLKNPVYHNHTLKLQLMNTIINSHDLCCGCPTPILHIKEIINTFSYSPCPRTTKKKKNNLKNKKTTNTLKSLKNKKLNHLFTNNKKNTTK